VAKVLFKTFGMESTAAGTVPEFDRIPFYRSNENHFDTKIVCKSMENNNTSLISFSNFYEQ